MANDFDDTSGGPTENTSLIALGSAPDVQACFEDALWMTQSAPTIHDGMNFGSARSRNFRRSASRIASAFRTSSAEAVRGEGSKIPAARRSLVVTVTIPD